MDRRCTFYLLGLIVRQHACSDSSGRLAARNIGQDIALRGLCRFEFFVDPVDFRQMPLATQVARHDSGLGLCLRNH